MKVYFFIPNKNLQIGIKNKYLHIIELMRDSQMQVFTNLDDSCDKYIAQFGGDNRETFLLTHMDAILIDGSRPSSEVGYIVAFALSNKKPVLYLLERGLMLDSSLRQLEKDKHITGLLKINHYTDQSLEKIIRDYLEGVSEGTVLKETPNIKFTLRITSSIDKYLDWKAGETKKTKADFLRDVICDDLIKKDEAYKKYRDKHSF